MRPSVRVLLATAATALALTMLPAVAGADSDSDDDLLRSDLVGSVPFASGGPVLFGSNPGGAPWVVDKGRVKVSRDGEIEVRLEGFVIPVPPFNGTNPVPAISVSLACNGVRGVATATVPLSRPGGDARLRATVAVPSPCLAPAILVHPNGNVAAYIANG